MAMTLLAVTCRLFHDQQHDHAPPNNAAAPHRSYAPEKIPRTTNHSHATLIISAQPAQLSNDWMSEWKMTDGKRNWLGVQV